MRLWCWYCHKSVSTELPESTVFRASATCPECIELYETPWADLVEKFNRANGDEPPDQITTDIGPKLKLQRLRLMMEELGELACAMHTDNLVEIADGITDLLYVTVGTAVAYGMTEKLDALFREVQRSNMTKTFGAKPDGSKGGVKGPNWSPPDIKGILES